MNLSCALVIRDWFLDWIPSSICFFTSQLLSWCQSAGLCPFTCVHCDDWHMALRCDFFSIYGGCMEIWETSMPSPARIGKQTTVVFEVMWSIVFLGSNRPVLGSSIIPKTITPILMAIFTEGLQGDHAEPKKTWQLWKSNEISNV